MYGLLKLIPSGVDSLRDELEGYFKKQGLAAIEKCEDVTSVCGYALSVRNQLRERQLYIVSSVLNWCISSQTHTEFDTYT